ncbi:hypothetical protein GJW-30_1_01650 [Variibacter gotjawalensis]|uniref:Uncharacterized protein n=2 Tax=Variibacter gotjawalensis TaxID=1333996 RepID=A0A0S3PT31_9BRAD|nr:ADP-ribose pyrophosphatase YjhB (NUDIX family) [Variibacter gotjawalensis]BAT59121.1 hypothetical protein GJW-30_1_01650 [Variibacter gotjawalensis]
MSAHRVAAREAREEAGVEGSIQKRSLGSFKDAGGKDRVVVYALKVKKELKRWLEQGERKQKWLPILKATRKVDQKGLRAIMRQAAKAL